MSLSAQAQKIAADNTEAARAAAKQRRAAVRQKQIEKLEKMSGLPARYVDTREVAHHTYLKDTYGFGRGGLIDGVEVTKEAVYAVDDLEFVFSSNNYPFLLRHDVSHGFYRCAIHAIHVYVCTDETQEQAFVKALGKELARKIEHPKVVAAKSASVCPTCSRPA